MSDSNIITFSCEKCGADNDAEIWSCISANDAPELRGAIMTGSLFICRCKACGALAGLKYPCLYHDREKKFMVYLIPDAERTEDFSRVPLPAEILMSDLNMDGYRLRVARGSAELADKIHVFEAGLDDRAAETCKLLALGQLRKRRSDYTPNASHFERRGDKDVASFINEQGESAQVYLESGLYDEVLKSVRELEDDEPRFDIIDLAWAQDFVRRAQNMPQG